MLPMTLFLSLFLRRACFNEALSLVRAVRRSCQATGLRGYVFLEVCPRRAL